MFWGGFSCRLDVVVKYLTSIVAHSIILNHNWLGAVWSLPFISYDGTIKGIL